MRNLIPGFIKAFGLPGKHNRYPEPQGQLAFPGSTCNYARPIAMDGKALMWQTNANNNDNL